MADHCLINNPDISGVGVRTSFYFQTLFLVLLAERSWQDAPPLLWTFISTSFGLTIAAIVQSRTGQLSFFQALQVSNLVWMANFGIFLATATYVRKEAGHKGPNPKARKSDRYVATGATIQTLFSMCLTIYLWKNAATFGNETPACFATVRYVVFAWGLFASGKGRVLALTVSSVLLVVYLVLTLQELRSAHARRRRRRERARSDVTEPDAPATAATAPVPPVVPPPEVLNPLIAEAPRTSARDNPAGSSAICRRDEEAQAQANDRGARRVRRPPRRDWFAQVDPMFLGVVTLTIVIVYFVVSSELLLRRNHGPDNSAGKWGFGQILALIVLTPSVLAVIEAFGEKGLNKHAPTHQRKSSTNRDRRPIPLEDMNGR